ncbi:MAG: FAD-dependent thymidylate synthase [Candidatus Omnitrophota bacterium]|jgi:thymidylate synthase (FAD)
MILVKPSFDILHITDRPLELIEQAGRTCYKSEDRMTPESAFDFAEKILKRGHESVIEHVSATVKFVVDRGVSHEIVRHRLASYSQESTRYCDYSGGHIAFVIPPWVNIKPNKYELPPKGQPLMADWSWFLSTMEAEARYKHLRSLGWKPEQARSVLPNSLKTEIVMTANLREWRHFFKLRTAPSAHPQMREITVPLLKEMRLRIPVIFNDIKPDTV